MVSALRVLNLVLCVAAFAAPVFAQEIDNWPAPATWTPAAQSRTLHTMSAVASPFPFIGVTPCRQYDSRNFTPLPQNTAREIVITGAPCGIPVSAEAVSLNITVFDILGQTGNAVFQVGAISNPTTAWINYAPGQGQIGNAGVLPLSGAHSIFFRVQQGGGSIDFTLDVNGYYAGAGTGSFNTFLGLNAGNFTMSGDSNTAIGTNALSANTTGFDNTASGAFALFSNTTGESNTASGRSALAFNTGGVFNTAIGASALVFNTGGSSNTAIGASALANNATAFYNTASGAFALVNNTTGGNNTATGAQALQKNITGSSNTASGATALQNNTTGFDNIAIGNAAGVNLTTGNSNIEIGNAGLAGESATIRIGDQAVHTDTYIGGIFASISAGGSAVFANSAGKLGTSLSARRFKQDIREIGEASDGLMRLRPVTFRYKPEFDSKRLTQYGLIAEEVAEVYPELVAYDPDGKPLTVHYHLVNTLLLNEVQNQRRTIEEQERKIEKQTETIEELEARLARLETRLTAEPQR